MKRILALALLCVAIVSALPNAVDARSYRTKSSDVYVKGYTKKNGTYVAPHYRSKADGIVSNNYSCIDNGKCGRSTYLNIGSGSTLNTGNGTKLTSPFSDEACNKLYGPASKYDKTTASCGCYFGYGFDAKKSQCIYVESKPIVESIYNQNTTITGIKKTSGRIQTFADGSQLNLDTGEVINVKKILPAENYIPPQAPPNLSSMRFDGRWAKNGKFVFSQILPVGLIMKGETDTKVFVIDGCARYLKDAALLRIYGSSWKDSVNLVEDSLLAGYPICQTVEK